MTAITMGTSTEGLTLSWEGSGDLVASLVVPGLQATTMVEPSYVHGFNDLVAYFAGLVEDWRGWEGSRSWTSIDHVLGLSARHTGSTVELEVTLGRDAGTGASSWRCAGEFTVDAGEQLRRIHQELARLG